MSGVAGLVLSVVWLGLLGLKAWAVVDCLSRPPAAFELHNKQTKVIWIVILGLSFALGFLSSAIGIFGIAGTIAAIVYLVDVRPAVSGRSTL
jgi:hypothetical protein